MRLGSSSPFRQSDLIGIVDNIGQDNPQAARRVCEDIRTRCDALAGMPEMRVETRPGIRLLVIGSYLGFYRLRGGAGPTDVEILRVIHGARQIPPDFGD